MRSGSPGGGVGQRHEGQKGHHQARLSGHPPQGKGKWAPLGKTVRSSSSAQITCPSWTQPHYTVPETGFFFSFFFCALGGFFCVGPGGGWEGAGWRVEGRGEGKALHCSPRRLFIQLFFSPLRPSLRSVEVLMVAESFLVVLGGE